MNVSTDKAMFAGLTQLPGDVDGVFFSNSNLEDEVVKNFTAVHGSTGPAGLSLVKLGNSFANPTFVPSGTRAGTIDVLLGGGPGNPQKVGGLSWDTAGSIGSGTIRARVMMHDGVSLQEAQNGLLARIQTTNPTPAVAMVLPIPSGRLMSISARWHGRQIGTGTELLRESAFVVRRFGATPPAQIGSTVDIFPTYKDDATWADPGFIVTGSLIPFTVQGGTGPVDWDVEAWWREL